MDAFVAIADPTRREMLELLRQGDRPAGELGARFPTLSQPGISKHLRVLREAGLVTVRPDEQRRVYSLRPQGLAELHAWISRYQTFWTTSLDALEQHLATRSPKAPPTPPRRPNPKKRNRR